MTGLFLYASSATPPELSQKELQSKLEGIRQELASFEFRQDEIDTWISELKNGHIHGWPREINRYFLSYLEEFADRLPLSNGNDLRSCSTLYNSTVVMALFEEPLMTPFGPEAVKNTGEDCYYWLNYLSASRLQQLHQHWTNHPPNKISPLDTEVVDFVETFDDPQIGMFCVIDW
jgi:hypothetical protein